MADEELEMHDEAPAQQKSDAESSSAKPRDTEKDVTEDLVASTTSEVRDEMRQEMENDVAAFLAKGGKIQTIDDNVMADPPRKPQSSYGSRPI